MSYSKTKSELDLFAFLEKLNKRDHMAYDELVEDHKKAIAPLVIQRWLAGTGDKAQLVRLNETSNRFIFSLGQEKTLLFKLLAAACTGAKRNYWLKGPAGEKTSLSLEAIKLKFGCSTREAVGYLKLLDLDDITSFAEETGFDKEQLKKLSAELKGRKT